MKIPFDEKPYLKRVEVISGDRNVDLNGGLDCLRNDY